MPDADAPPVTDRPFASAAELRDAHGELLRHSEFADKSELAGEIVAFLGRAAATGALLFDAEERLAIQRMLTYWENTLYRLGFEPPDRPLAPYDPGLAPELDEALCPYVGMAAFSPAQAELFFGRERVVEDWVGRLEAGRALLVVGPGGSGRTSLVRAGLVAALRGGRVPGSESWRYPPPVEVDGEALARLARAAITPEAAAGPDPAAWVAEQVDRLRVDPSHFARLLDLGPGRPALVVVDRLGEAFDLPEADRRAFLGNLEGLAARPDSRHRLVMVSRLEDPADAERLEALPARLREETVRVDPPTAGELREAIVRPAERVGLRFEDGVVDALVHDLAGDASALPLLQFTLRRLWERRRRNLIPLEAYREVGSGRLAPARHADAFYRGLGSDEDREAARQILLALTRPGQGRKVATPCLPLAEIAAGGDDPARIGRVLDRLVDAELVRRTDAEGDGGPRFVLACEALASHWPLLAGWLEDLKIERLRRRKLTDAAEHWRARGEEPGLLWRGSNLEDAEAYTDKSPLEARFVAAGRAAADAEEARRRRNRRILAVGSFALAALVIGLLLVSNNYEKVKAAAAEAESDFMRKFGEEALARQQEADARRQEAELRRLFAQSAALQGDQLDLAMLLAGEAAGRHPEAAEARGGLLSALLHSPRVRAYLPGHAEPIAALAAAPGGWLATADVAGRILLWDRDRLDGRRAGPPPALPGADADAGATGPARFTDLAASPDGSALAAARDDGAILAWDLSDRGRPRRLDPVLRVPAPGRVRLAIGRVDGGEGRPRRVLAAGSADGTIRLWDLDTDTPEPIGRPWDAHIPGETGGVTALGFSPDGRWLVSGGDDTLVVRWDCREEPPARRAIGSHSEAVTDLAFSPDRRTLATAGKDNVAILWGDVGGRAPRALGRPLAYHSDDVSAVAFSPDGGLLATGGDDEVIVLWEVQSLRPIDAAPLLRGHSEPVVDLAFDPHPGAERLVSGGRGGKAIAWDLRWTPPPATGRILLERSYAVRSVAVDPGGNWLASGTGDGSVQLWALGESGPTGLVGRPLDRHAHPVTALAVRADGGLLASGDSGGTIHLWAVGEGPPRHVAGFVARPGEDVNELAFSPDGRTLAAAVGKERSEAVDEPVRLWDVADPAAPAPLPGLRLGDARIAWCVAFRPGGGRVLAAGGSDGRVRLRDLDDPDAPGFDSGPEHALGVHALAFAPDGARLASGGWDGSVLVWAAAPGGAPRLVEDDASPARLEPGHGGDVRSVAFLDDRLLATGSVDETILIWDVRRLERLGDPLTGHTDGIWGLARLPGDGRIASGSWDGSIRFWRVLPDDHGDAGDDATPERADDPVIGKPLLNRQGYLDGLAFSPDGRYLAADDPHAGIHLIDLEARAARGPQGRPDRDPVEPMKLRRGDDGRALDAILAVAFGPGRDRATLAAGGLDGAIDFWRVEPGRGATWAGLAGEPSEAAGVNALAFRPDDGSIVAAGRADGSIDLFRVDDPARPVPLGGPAGAHRADGPPEGPRAGRLESAGLPSSRSAEGKAGVRALAFAPGGRLLASAGDDALVRLWRLDAEGRIEPEPVARAEAGSPVNDLAFRRADDGGPMLLAAGGDDGELCLWAVAEGPETPALEALCKPLKAHKDEVYAVAFGPDGRTLATAGGDRTIRLWHVDASGLPQALGNPIAFHAYDVRALAFRDGRTLASGGEEGTLALWSVGLDDWIGLARRIAGRGLDPDERDAYLPGGP